jgi:geranylgeranyl diphosphate synthase type I
MIAAANDRHRPTGIGILGPMTAGTADAPAELLLLRERVDDVLREFLDERRRELGWIDPHAVEPIDEVSGLLDAGGKRLRPAFCYWGFRAAGGPDGEPILRAAAAFELLHSMALIHDDVMDGAHVRRGRPTAQVRQAEAAAARGVADPGRIGTAVAILAGDLAAVLADQLLLESGFPAERLTAALARYHRTRLEMAAGQFLDLTDADADPRRLAFLKGGSYTVAGPLRVGAALAGAAPEVDECLRRYGEPLGQAFQLLDDLRDDEAAPGITVRDPRSLADEATAAIDREVLDGVAADALEGLADLVGGAGAGPGAETERS